MPQSYPGQRRCSTACLGPGSGNRNGWATNFQVFCDFSGYSDVVIGAAMLFGLTLPKNFDRSVTWSASSESGSVQSS